MALSHYKRGKSALTAKPIAGKTYELWEVETHTGEIFYSIECLHYDIITDYTIGNAS